MAGSFHVFRRYQRAALVALAIMAMIAFVLLPPVPMGVWGSAAADTVAVSWKGGQLREGQLQRAVLSRRAINQFLMALQAAASGSDRVSPPLPDDERAVFNSLLLAREAEANGLVVSDTVVNDFLALWTGNRVAPDRIANVIDQLRDRVGVTEQDIFDGLRTFLLGERLQALTMRGTGFAGSPPGWRWDAFRRLEQSATVEVVPVIVESLGGEKPAPSTAELEKLFDRFKEDLPQARSPNPGFREPPRARYEAVVAPSDAFVAEAEAKVTDEAIAKYYEDNKDSRYRESEPPAGDAKPPAAAEREPPAKDPAAEPGPPPADPAAEAAAAGKPPASGPESGTAAPASRAPPAAAPAGDGSAVRRAAVRAVAFRAADDAPPAPAEPGAAAGADAAAAPAEPDAAPSSSGQTDPPPVDAEKQAAPEGDTPAEGGAQPADKPAEAEKQAEKPVAFKPLDQVRDEIRGQLARQAAAQRVKEAFGEVERLIADYADDRTLALGKRQPVPQAPDVGMLAAERGLEPLRSDLVERSEAIAAGGIGASFLLRPDQRFGLVQEQWAELLLSPATELWQPVGTQDVAGTRYLSWKTEVKPDYTPAFADVKPEVERVWRLLEARPLARKLAEEIASAAAGKPLAEAIAGREGLEAVTVGPFTWLTRGTAPFGSAPMLSQPDGVQMPGEAFMEAVFGLEPGGTTVAFNEPETICYAIRLVSLEPAEEILRERFLDASADPRRMAVIADEETREVFNRWLEGIEKRQAVDWKRPPR